MLALQEFMGAIVIARRDGKQTACSAKPRDCAIGILVMDARIRAYPRGCRQPGHLPVPGALPHGRRRDPGTAHRRARPVSAGAVHRGRMGAGAGRGAGADHHLRLHDPLPGGARARVPGAGLHLEPAAAAVHRAHACSPQAGSGSRRPMPPTSPPEHLRAAGGDADRLTVCGLENEPFFREAIFSRQRTAGGRQRRSRGGGAGPAHGDGRPRASGPSCSSARTSRPTRPPSRTAVGLPVYDFVTMLH
ncbi:MAG: hypothetical protein MZV70_55895 [Desulfobacterales bacterium]|nr:hypothetical protein [Desulfobacterales bacterium]